MSDTYRPVVGAVDVVDAAGVVDVDEESFQMEQWVVFQNEDVVSSSRSVSV